MLRNPDLPHQIAATLREQDYVVLPHALTDEAVTQLRNELLHYKAAGQLQPAAVGRAGERQIASHTRSDLTLWLTGETAVQQQWLTVMDAIRTTLNQQLLLGLAEYECHYACYPPGSFYRRHLDSFRGNNARRVSTVLYLNATWQEQDCGLLKLYANQATSTEPALCQIQPQPGTLVAFLSENVPHEVTEARRERYSVAGWLRQRV